jgi:hypothetical protein
MKMSNIINDPVLISSIQDLARGIESEADLSSLTRELLKITVEASLNGEMEAHLGYPNQRHWEAPVKRYVDECVQGKEAPGKKTLTCAG